MAQLRYVILSSDLSTLLKGEPLPLPEDRSLDTFYLDMIDNPTNGDMIKALFPDAKDWEAIIPRGFYLLKCFFIVPQ